MKSTDDQQHNGVFALIKGPPGTGKSVLAESFPNTFTLDFDRKMPTVPMKHYPGKKFDWECYDDVFKLAEQLKDWYQNGCPYETLIVDSITTLSTVCLNSVGKTMGQDVIKMMQTAQKSKDGGITVEIMGINYYNAESNFFERYFLDQMRSLWARPGCPKHVLFIAHLVKTESAPDLKTKVVTTTQSIVTAGRKVAAFIPTRFDEEYVVGYELPELGDSLTKPKRICITSSLGEANARTAFRLPEKIDFTDGNFFDLAVGFDPNFAGKVEIKETI